VTDARASGPYVHSVAELTTYIKGLFDGDPTLADAWVQGEVSNFVHAGSGHLYWTLKDGDASLRCVMWKGRVGVQRFLPEDGAKIVVHGEVSVYAAQGQYQIYADHVEPVGVGDLYRAFELLKAKLEAEGLFDAQRKRRPPAFPARIGVVTSRDAAALRDICRVIARRWPHAEVLLAPTLVQGDTAPPRIVDALAAVVRSSVDVVIVARGGGSLEDLWAFNDESVARAIAACPVPVVAGVGHETDFTIADFAADMRAATPTAAAELVTPDGRELMFAVDEARRRLSRRIVERLTDHRGETDQLRHRLTMASPQRRLGDRRESLADREARLHRAMEATLRVVRADLASAHRRLEALSPLATLDRGYALVSRRSDGRTVVAVADAPPNTGLTVRVADGAFPAVVEGQPHLMPPEEDA